MKFFKDNLASIMLMLGLAASFMYLDRIEKSQQDLDYGKNWWSLYFQNPKDNSLDFTIENHSDSTNFKWEVYIEKNKVRYDEISINKGTKKAIRVTTEQMSDKKILIRVSDGSQTKEIYKIL